MIPVSPSISTCAMLPAMSWRASLRSTGRDARNRHAGVLTYEGGTPAVPAFDCTMTAIAISTSSRSARASAGRSSRRRRPTVAPEVQDVAGQDEGLQGLVGLRQDRGRGAFVHLAGLDADDARLHVVDAPDAVLPCELVEGDDDRGDVRPVAVQGHGSARVEAYCHICGLIRRL